MMFVATAAMTLASCGKDDNTPAGNENPTDNLSQTEQMIVGSWNETEAIYILSQNGMCDTTSMLEEDESVEMTFKADKTYTTVYHTEDGDSEDGGTWSVDGDNSIVMSTMFGPIVYTIDHLDATTFNITYIEEGEDEDGPYTSTFKVHMTKK